MKPPALATAPKEYDPDYVNQINRVITQYLNGESGGRSNENLYVAPATEGTMAPEALQIQNQSLIAFTTGGTSTAYTLTPTPAITTYVTGQCFDINFHTTCGASPTLQISGLASPPNLVRLGSDGVLANIGAGEITVGMTSRVRCMSSMQFLVERLPRVTKKGTWTPNVGGNATYTAAIGNWVDNGDSVTLWYDITINVLGTGSTTRISGIPFANTGSNAAGSIGYILSSAINVLAIWCALDTSGTSMYFNGTTTASVGINNPLGIFGNGTRVAGTITYQK